MEESTGEGGCPFSFQRTRLPSRCRGFPISSRPTLSWGRRGFLALIEWPILWWGLVPASCAKVLPGTQQYFWLTRLAPALPEGGPLAGAEVPIPLPFAQYSYRGSPRHRLPNRSLVPTKISASHGSSPRSRNGALSSAEGLQPLVQCTSRPSSLPFLLPLRRLLPCASACVSKALGPRHVLCVSQPATALL